jgi:hypothetical protein
MIDINNRQRAWINLGAIVAAFGLNVLANTGTLGARTIADISNQDFADVLIIPASYAFAIWGLIYVGLFTFGIHQIVSKQYDHPLYQATGYWITIASGFQIIWVLLFLSSQFTLSLLAMIVILVALGSLYDEITEEESSFRRAKWYVIYPCSIYAGWISVATIVNVAVVLFSWGWRGEPLDPTWWTVLLITIAMLLGAWTKMNEAYKGVFIWAFIAIAVKNQSNLMIMTASFVGAIILTILLIAKIKKIPLPRLTFD